MEKKMKIFLPRVRGEGDEVFVSVNERTWIIRRGTEVEVPACVAEVIRTREDMLEESEKFSGERRK